MHYVLNVRISKCLMHTFKWIYGLYTHSTQRKEQFLSDRLCSFIFLKSVLLATFYWKSQEGAILVSVICIVVSFFLLILHLYQGTAQHILYQRHFYSVAL